jgi:hypothetical protein
VGDAVGVGVKVGVAAKGVAVGVAVAVGVPKATLNVHAMEGVAPWQDKPAPKTTNMGKMAVIASFLFIVTLWRCM